LREGLAAHPYARISQYIKNFQHMRLAQPLVVSPAHTGSRKTFHHSAIIPSGWHIGKKSEIIAGKFLYLRTRIFGKSFNF
jgi:hypothetical protein